VRILLTRPEPDARRTAEALRARGHAVAVVPLMRIEALSDPDLGNGPWAAILVTSANAARARFDQWHGVPVFAVGRRSAQAMRMAGFADVISADGNVDDLTHLVATRMKPGAPLLYLAGAERSGDLAGDLRSRGFSVHTAVVYRAVAVENMSRPMADALAGGIDGVPHFSRRGAEAYVKAARGADLREGALIKPVHFCLSARVAAPLLQAGAVNVRVAARPEEAALIELIEAA